MTAQSLHLNHKQSLHKKVDILGIPRYAGGGLIHLPFDFFRLLSASNMASLEEPPQPRESLTIYTDLVKTYLDSCGNRQQTLKLVVIGEAGQGKSTLINGLLGKEVANEGDKFKAGTLEIKYYHLNQNGVSVRIWDTPGFGMGSVKEEEKMVEELRRSECYPHDLALFCFRMDSTRFPTRVHIDTIQKFTEVFGKEFWKHTVFILTFANNVAQLCPPNEELEDFFSRRIWELEENIKETLKNHVNMSIDELETVRAIPVGSYKQGIDPKNPWALPDRDDWFVWFWMECTEHMRQSSVSALLHVNNHRINIVSEIAPEYGQPSDVNQPLERVIDYSRSEIAEIFDALVNENQSESFEQMPRESFTTSSSLQLEPSIQASSNTVQKSDQPISSNTTEHERTIPIYSVLESQLQKEGSDFNEHAKEYAQKIEDSDFNERPEEGAPKKKGSGKNPPKEEKSSWTQRLAEFFQGLLKWLKHRRRKEKVEKK